MKHKHEKWIHLMADGVRIETAVDGGCGWIGAYWGDFNDNNLTFRIAPNQPADAEGWIPWHGDENPAVGKIVCIKCRVGGVPVNFASNNLDWRHKESEGDIVAYRIVKQEKKWRWMYAMATNNTYDSLYLTAPMTEAEAKAWVSGRGLTTLGPRQDWTVVCDE